MKKIFFIFLILSPIFSCNSEDQVVEKEKEKINLFSEKAKVVGYLPSWNFGSFNKIEFCKLTHLNLAFANPDSEGNLIMADVSNIINKAKIDNPNIKISISIGGGSLTSAQASNWSNLIVSSENRSKIISKTVKYVLDNNFDGVDVDLEWEYVTTGYSEFIIGLNNELDKHSKIITAAFPAKTRYSKLNDAALNTFDFINIMAYDFTGPWNPSSPGQHSSYNHAEESINFWTNSVGISGEKLTVGVPFYGYDFSDSANVSAFSFSTMVSLNKSYAEIDNVGSKYYNGRPTIANKIKLAGTKLSGVMIWELGQDSFNEYSLLKTIHEEYSNLGVKTTNLCNN
jgi:GH18 family chitinase